MKITIENTTKIVEFNGVPARIWEGETDSGIQVHCYITRVAIDEDELKTKEFDRELQQQKKPTPAISAIPLRMII